MKLVGISIVGLVMLSLGYLISIERYTKEEDSLVVHNTLQVDQVIESQCTTTACMKKEIIASDGLEMASRDSDVRYTEFVNPSGFINSEPFLLSEYIGTKIILIEFVTYSCINCQRTFPYMQQWHEKYKDDGLLVIGIHTPEFSYERDRGNVIAAMQKEGITFPIVQDNDYETWNAYNNRFWPHRYIIDYNGNVVFGHIGEGAYSQTEEVIQRLLAQTPNGA